MPQFYFLSSPQIFVKLTITDYKFMIIKHLSPFWDQTSPWKHKPPMTQKFLNTPNCWHDHVTTPISSQCNPCVDFQYIYHNKVLQKNNYIRLLKRNLKSNIYTDIKNTNLSLFSFIFLIQELYVLNTYLDNSHVFTESYWFYIITCELKIALSKGHIPRCTFLTVLGTFRHRYYKSLINCSQLTFAK